MIIDGLRDYIRKCPCLEKFNNAVRVNVNYLADDTTTYTIEEVPTEPILKKYLDGSSKRQYNFIFASREPYGSDVLQNIANSGFYEEFVNWIENNEELPILGNNLEALKVEVLTSAYVIAVTEDTARFQIQARLVYLKKSKEPTV